MKTTPLETLNSAFRIPYSVFCYQYSTSPVEKKPQPHQIKQQSIKCFSMETTMYMNNSLQVML